MPPHPFITVITNIASITAPSQPTSSQFSLLTQNQLQPQNKRALFKAKAHMQDAKKDGRMKTDLYYKDEKEHALEVPGPWPHALTQ